MRALARVAVLVVLAVGLSAARWDGFDAPSRKSFLPARDAITDGKALLRYALPIDNIPIRRIQSNIEDIATQLRAKRRWRAIAKDLDGSNKILNLNRTKILADMTAVDDATAAAKVEELASGLAGIEAALDARDRETILTRRDGLLDLIGEIEADMVSDFPFEIPEDYAALPELLGRATVELTTSEGNVTVVLDGYSAPITAGNFVDLVDRGFYDGMEFVRAETSYVLQFGDPSGSEVGFIDPETGDYRAIPFEVMVRGETEPIYEFTLEEIGLYRAEPVLPFSAYGAIALARPESDANGGSSQVFFFLFEPELTPAGTNLLDGRYAVFGYTIEGKDVLAKLKEGDSILSAKVIDGLENLVEP